MNANLIKPKIYPLIVAAGTGSRLAADRPKQYLKLGEQTVLGQSMARLWHDRLEPLTLVVRQDDVYINAIIDKQKTLIYQAIGGAERWQSVLNGLLEVCQQGACDEDWLLIHDAARPCLPKTDLQNIINAIDDAQNSKTQAMILATAVIDTLKYADDGQVRHTVSRENLWQAQTPQAFKIGVLKAAFHHIQTHGLNVTDEASACELIGVPVQLILGSRTNIKLTYADDLPLIQAILANGQLTKL